MYYDITLPLTRKIMTASLNLDNKDLEGHIGTHFDCMEKTFPLEYTKREGIIFDISDVCGRDVQVSDIDACRIKKDMFVIFYSGYSEKVDYLAPCYFKKHPQFSHELIDLLVEKGVSVIGLDFGGLRRSVEHFPADRKCAEKGTFVIENLINLTPLLSLTRPFTVFTLPMSLTFTTGIPCRVVVQA